MKSAAWKSAAMAVCGMALAVALMGAGGCVNYASYPAVAQDTATNDPNNPAMEEVMMAGLRWVANKYPAGPISPIGERPASPPEVAVNLPPGVKPNVYRRVAAAVPGGQPLTPQNESLPTYHVSAIRVRGDEANIWIFRPALDLGRSPKGGPVYQEVKLWLRGGFQPWHVVSSLEQTPGTGEMPTLSYYAEEPAPIVQAAAPAETTYTPPPKPIANAEEQTPPGGDPMPQTEPPPAGQPRP